MVGNLVPLSIVDAELVVNSVHAARGDAFCSFAHLDRELSAVRASASSTPDAPKAAWLLQRFPACGCKVDDDGGVGGVPQHVRH